MPVPPVYLLENRDEHWRNILEKILRLHAIEEGSMLAQFVRDLVDDEVTAVRERLICFRQQRSFLFDFENAVDARVFRKLAPEIPGKGGIQLEEEQLGAG